MSSPKELSPSEKMRAVLPSNKRAQNLNSFVYFFLGLATITFLFFTCFCGAGMWFFRPTPNENPESVRSIVDQIASISVPDSFVPKGSIDWNIAFVARIRGVYYERLVGDGVLSLVEVDSKILSDENVHRNVRETLMEKSSSGTMLVIDKQRTRRELYEISGEPVMFTFSIAKDARTNEEYHLVDGVFRGNDRQPVHLSLRVDSNRWLDEPGQGHATATADEASRIPRWIEKMLSSIGKPPVENEAAQQPPEPLIGDPSIVPTPVTNPQPELSPSSAAQPIRGDSKAPQVTPGLE